MYRKNTSGQFLCVQLLLTATGAVATGLSPAMRRCIDGTFAAGGGTFTEDGTTGSYKYAMSQADTNGNDISFITTATGAIPVCINIVTTAADPTNATTFGLTNLDAAITSRMATYTQPTGFLAATFPSGTVANTTNITAGTVTTATNVTTVNGLAANIITAASIAADAGAEIADVLLDRDMSTGTDSGSTTVRTPRQALRFLRNKWDITAGTLTVTKENDSTTSWTAAVTTDALASPVVANDPAGP